MSVTNLSFKKKYFFCESSLVLLISYISADIYVQSTNFLFLLLVPNMFSNNQKIFKSFVCEMDVESLIGRWMSIELIIIIVFAER